MKFNDHWWCFVLFLVAGATVYVHGRGARPTLSQCVISDSENVGIFVTDGAQVGNTCTVMFKPSNLDMPDVKFFKIRKRHLKSEFALLQTLSRLFHLVQFIKCWQFSQGLNSKGLYQSSGTEKESRCLVLTSSIKREVRHFYVTS